MFSSALLFWFSFILLLPWHCQIVTGYRVFISKELWIVREIDAIYSTFPHVHHLDCLILHRAIKCVNHERADFTQSASPFFCCCFFFFLFGVETCSVWVSLVEINPLKPIFLHTSIDSNLILFFFFFLPPWLSDSLCSERGKSDSLWIF